jgi:hypothetical protein
MNDAELFARHITRHLRWSVYYSMASLAAAGCAFSVMDGPWWGFWFINACCWFFVCRGRKHRRMAGLE